MSLFSPDSVYRTPSPFASSPLGDPIKGFPDNEENGEDHDEKGYEPPRKSITHPPQRMVSWQDEVQGQDLHTVREFEPSEVGPEAEELGWEHERKTCCSIM